MLTVDRRLLALAYALPGLALFAGGYLHPGLLRSGTASLWFWLHVAGLVAFPAVGVAIAALYRPAWAAGSRRGLARVLAPLVLLGSFVYAVFYSALDVIAGVAASYLWRDLPADAARPEVQPRLFEIGDLLGVIGAAGLGIAVVAVAVDFLLRYGLPAVGGLLLLPGAYLVWQRHIFFPDGAIGMALLGIGTGWLAYVAAGAAQKSLVEGSSTPRSAS